MVRTYVMEFPAMPVNELEILVRRRIGQDLPAEPAVAMETRPGQEGGVEVNAVALPGELVTSSLSNVADYGMAAEAAYADVTALAECARAAYPGVDEHATCIFNMGATWSELVLLNRGHLVFSRSIKVGVTNLVESIADLCSLPADEAEKLIFSTGAAVSFDETDERDFIGRSYAESVRDVMEQVVVEIQRSLSFASLRRNLPWPRVVLLCGGASKVPGMADVLSRETGAAVEVFDPLEHMLRGDDVDPETDGSLYCVAIGLALMALRRGSPAFRRDGRITESTLEARIPPLIALAAATLLVIFVSARVLDSSARQYEAAVEAESAVLESMKQWRVPEAANPASGANERSHAFSLLNEPSPVWRDVLMEISRAVPEGVVFDDVTFNRTPASPGMYSEWTLSASGVVTDMDNTTALLMQVEDALEDSPLFASVEILPEGLMTLTYEGRTLTEAVRFELEAALE
jgi:Tfp pilus assembly PilM family ATPase